MPNSTKNALLSAYNKQGLEEHAQVLIDLGFTIYSSGGTAKYLAEKGIKVIDVATIVGPAILGHRVVTLSRELFAGILAKDTPEDRAELDRVGAPFFDLVYVDPYPLKEAMEQFVNEPDKITEMIDIGGPSMLRAAAKAGRFVAGDRAAFEVTIDFLEGRYASRPEVTEEKFKALLAAQVERLCSEYSEAARAHHLNRAHPLSFRDL